MQLPGDYHTLGELPAVQSSFLVQLSGRPVTQLLQQRPRPVESTPELGPRPSQRFIFPGDFNVLSSWRTLI